MNDEIPDHLLRQMAADAGTISGTKPTLVIRDEIVPAYPVKGKPKTHQVRALLEAGGKDGHAWWMDPGAGKRQPLSSRIMTPNGWVKMGDLKVGDVITGSNGEPTRVNAIHPQGEGLAYRVTMSDGSSTLCCIEHLWRVKPTGCAWTTLTLGQMMERGILRASGKPKFGIPIVGPVFHPWADLPLDPYLTGTLLGDGSMLQKVYISCPPERRAAVEHAISNLPDGVSVVYEDYGSTPRYAFRSGGRASTMKAILRDLGLQGLKSPDRFIPDRYLFSHENQRRELLAGLMDTDGSCVTNRVRFHSMSARLAADVRSLVQSLGGTARLRVTDRGDKGLEYTVSIKLLFNPFKYRQTNWRLASKANRPIRKIVSVTSDGIYPMQCISVSASDHLYVTDEYIVTHNTFTAIAECGLLYEQGEIDGVVIFAPNGPHEQWIDEQFPLWCGVRYNAITNRNAPGAKRKFFENKREVMGVMSINFDALATRNGEDMIARFYEKYPRVYLIIDESQKIKNPRAKRTKEALKWSLRSAYRRTLSGTPLLKGLEDLWSQYEACKPGLAWPHEPVRLTGTGKVNTYGYMGYRTHFCITRPVPGNPRAQIIVGYRNEAELIDRTGPYSTRIMSDEFMKGEEPDFITVRCPMTDEQARHYRTMKDHLLALLDSSEITVSNALSQMQKLQQIASGFIYQEEGPPQRVGSNKIDAAMEIIEQLSEPVIVWSPFIELQSMIVQALHDAGYTDRIYTGIGDVEPWKEDPVGILVGNQTSGLGVGMNLQHAAANIYLANSFSSEARWQSLKRTDRIGQTRQVRNWDLIAPGTTDETVMASLRSKEDISRRTVDQLREMIR